MPARQQPPLETLRRLGPILLGLLTGPRAVALNRAAAADPTGELGQAISELGRETIAPLVAQTLEASRLAGELAFSDTTEITEQYLGLLIGDLQIRRVIGRQPPPDPGYISERSKFAFDSFYRLNRAE